MEVLHESDWFHWITNHEEMQTRIELCDAIGVRPVFVARMLPKTWIMEIQRAGGFALILKYQLYPWAHRDLARRVRESRSSCR